MNIKELLTFFVPDALMGPVLPASPRQALRRLRLPWRKGKVEKMVQRLTRSHLGSTLRRRGLTLYLCEPLTCHLRISKYKRTYSLLSRRLGTERPDYCGLSSQERL